MNQSLHSIILGCGILSAVAFTAMASAAAADASRADLPAAQKRSATVERAVLYAQQKDAASLPADLKNPFSPQGFDQADVEDNRIKNQTAESSKALGDNEILESIAAKLKPSGSLVFSGQPILLYGQKKLKVGDHLTISFEGHDYEVEITTIERTTYTLRLNRAEITRPINPGKTP
jgi:hypothetical protein